jgi:hypothetical protein
MGFRTLGAEAGFARLSRTGRDRNRPASQLRRLLKRIKRANARKEGANGGTRGFPRYKTASITRSGMSKFA